MRNYTCPKCRDTCRCGKARPSDPLVSGHAQGLLVVVVILAIGGIGKLAIWAGHRFTVQGWLALAVLVTGLVAWRVIKIRSG